MCRFIAFRGQSPIFLKSLVDTPSNSLIHQSKESMTGGRINGDGFGLSWYDHQIEMDPGIFKSTRPAWNDPNLEHLCRKIKSNCFLAHIRASTVGDVTLSNCHPFTHEKFSLVHNGTIRAFPELRRSFMNLLTDEFFPCVKGQTDSEYIFFLIMGLIKNEPEKYTMEGALLKAFLLITEIQKNYDDDTFSKLNVAITDGSSMIVTRYTSKGHPCLPLYYNPSMDFVKNPGNNIVIASEPLTDNEKMWQEVPENHYIIVSPDLELTVKPF